MRQRWNHNIHYHPTVLRALPAGAQRVLDIGCGEGMLTRQLRRTVPDVTGIDLDEPSLALAREQSDDIEYVRGDFLTHPFEPFDAVVSVATLHHVDATAGLTRMRDLLRPGGVLVVVGVARESLPRDLPLAVAGALVNRAYILTKGYLEHPSPVVWPPPVTYTQMRALSAELLPGARYRHHLFFRYSITWQKPRAGS